MEQLVRNVPIGRAPGDLIEGGQVESVLELQVGLAHVRYPIVISGGQVVVIVVTLHLDLGIVLEIPCPADQEMGVLVDIRVEIVPRDKGIGVEEGNGGSRQAGVI